MVRVRAKVTQRVLHVQYPLQTEDMNQLKAIFQVDGPQHQYIATSAVVLNEVSNEPLKYYLIIRYDLTLIKFRY